MKILGQQTVEKREQNISGGDSQIRKLSKKIGERDCRHTVYPSRDGKITISKCVGFGEVASPHPSSLDDGEAPHLLEVVASGSQTVAEARLGA